MMKTDAQLGQPRTRSIRTVPLLFAFAALCAPVDVKAQRCALTVSSAIGDCLRQEPISQESPILQHDSHYSLATLIDLAERSSPETGVMWARAKAAWERHRIDEGQNVPTVTLSALGSDERDISPFPKPLAPRGYVTVEVPLANAQLNLQYALVDFARLPQERASAQRASAALLELGRTEQDLAFNVERAYFNAQDAYGAVRAAEQNLDTAQTLLANSEEQFQRGRATLPDVEDARAGAAQARYQLAQTRAEAQHTKITLAVMVGAQPTPDYVIDPQAEDISSSPLASTVQELISEARRYRPDLMAIEGVEHAKQEEVRKTRAAYLPSLSLRASGGQTAEWPTVDSGTLGPANVTTWRVGAEMQWTLFDGTRSHRVAEAKAALLETGQRKRVVDDEVAREVWDAYVDFNTAIEQLRDAEQFLSAARTSYASASEAYRYGVRSLVDVVQSEKALADARFSVVHSRTSVLRSAAAVNHAVGTRVDHLLSKGGMTP